MTKNKKMNVLGIEMVIYKDNKEDYMSLAKITDFNTLAIRQMQSLLSSNSLNKLK
jgi:hypothetical protein